MSWWKRIFGGGEPVAPEEPAVLSDAELFEQLGRALEVGGPEELHRLCQLHTERIVSLMPTWRTVPEAQRADPEALQRYGNTLGNVANMFQQVMNDPRIFEILSGDETFGRWAKRREEALGLAKELKYSEALSLLEADETEMRKMEWVGDNEPLMLTLGTLGQLLFHAGQVERAIGLFEEVLANCRRIADLEGQGVYLRALFDACRYLDRGVAAAAWERELADLCEQTGAVEDAERHRRHAEQFPEGEPLLRMVLTVAADDGVVTWEVGDIPELAPEQRYNVMFLRGRPGLIPGAILTQRGRALADAGDLDDALELFRQAAEADPLAPECRYLAAFTLLIQGKIDESIPLQEEVMALAPGWYDNEAWLDLSRRIPHEIPAGVVSILRELDDGPLPPAQKAELAGRALLKMPRVALLHVHRGRALVALGRIEEAQQSYRAALEVVGADRSTQSVATLELSQTLEGEERLALLRAIMALEGGSLRARTFAAMMLAQPISAGE